MLPVNSKLIDLLRAIFPATPLPARILLDEKDYSEFSEDIRLQFISKLWTSVTLDNWTNTAGIEVIPYYMAAEAFHYYLPSLLSISLSTGEYIDWSLKAILPNNNSREPKGEWWANYFACFDDKQ